MSCGSEVHETCLSESALRLMLKMYSRDVRRSLGTLGKVVEGVSRSNVIPSCWLGRDEGKMKSHSIELRIIGDKQKTVKHSSSCLSSLFLSLWIPSLSPETQ